MGSLCPDEIVASVMGWSNDYVMCGQRFECTFKNRTRQVWAIAVEGNNASLATFSEVCKHGTEACDETLTALRDYAHFATCQLC